jgi:hypothetical protein
MHPKHHTKSKFELIDHGIFEKCLWHSRYDVMKSVICLLVPYKNAIDSIGLILIGIRNASYIFKLNSEQDSKLFVFGIWSSLYISMANRVVKFWLFRSFFFKKRKCFIFMYQSIITKGAVSNCSWDSHEQMHLYL